MTRYTRLGASSRLRSLQYADCLGAAGIETEVAPLFGDSYLRRLYSGARPGADAARALLRRAGQLRASAGADLIWLEKEALPWLPWAVEKALLPRRVPVVADYDDAIFHRYDMSGNRVVRKLLGAKIDRVMAASTMVLAGNDYLAARAGRAGARRVEVVPTVVDIDAYSTERRPEADGRARIGWIGSPSTWKAYVVPMLPMLAGLAAEHGARLRVVGAGEGAATQPEIEALPWSEATEVAQIQAMDIGVMPLDNSPWSRGKCGYKLIQYMACGLPVIASPVGVNSRIVRHGVNGFLVSTPAEWREALVTLLSDPDLGRRMGREGRALVEAEYSLQVWGPRVAALLNEAAGRA